MYDAHNHNSLSKKKNFGCARQSPPCVRTRNSKAQRLPHESGTYIPLIFCRAFFCHWSGRDSLLPVEHSEKRIWCWRWRFGSQTSSAGNGNRHADGLVFILVVSWYFLGLVNTCCCYNRSISTSNRGRYLLHHEIIEPHNFLGAITYPLFFSRIRQKKE